MILACGEWQTGDSHSKLEWVSATVTATPTQISWPIKLMKNCHPKKILASWTLLVNKIPHLPEISRFFFSIKFHSGMSVFLFLYQIESSLIKATNNQSKYSELSYISSTWYQPFELEPSSCIHDKLAPMTLCAWQLLLFPIKAKNKITRKKIKKV